MASILKMALKSTSDFKNCVQINGHDYCRYPKFWYDVSICQSRSLVVVKECRMVRSAVFIFAFHRGRFPIVYSDLGTTFKNITMSVSLAFNLNTIQCFAWFTLKWIWRSYPIRRDRSFCFEESRKNQLSKCIFNSKNEKSCVQWALTQAKSLPICGGETLLVVTRSNLLVWSFLVKIAMSMSKKRFEKNWNVFARVVQGRNYSGCIPKITGLIIIWWKPRIVWRLWRRNAGCWISKYCVLMIVAFEKMKNCFTEQNSDYRRLKYLTWS